jgi:hypothetical protein
MTNCCTCVTGTHHEAMKSPMTPRKTTRQMLTQRATEPRPSRAATVAKRIDHDGRGETGRTQRTPCRRPPAGARATTLDERPDELVPPTPALMRGLGGSPPGGDLLQNDMPPP